MYSAKAQSCAKICIVKAKETTSSKFFDEYLRRVSSRASISLTKRQLKQYCDILGIPVTASEPKIKQAFYKKSLLLHPDLNKGVNSQQAFTEISEAYQAMITHKKGEGEGFEQQTWRRTAEMGGFRPWVKVPQQDKSQASPFTTSSVEMDEHLTSHHSVGDAMLIHESNAGDWCNEFYIEQMEKDFKKHFKGTVKKQNINKDNTNNACVVM